jgi:mono/diheme cytochrome c family protein
MNHRASSMLAGVAALATLWAALRSSRSNAPTREKPITVPTTVIALSICLASAALWATIAFYPPEDPALGLARTYGCAGCHTIDGLPGVGGRVGPPLAGLAQRTFVAGVVRNELGPVAKWMTDPPGVDPRTAMPRTGINEAEALEVLRYLYRH